MSILIKNAQLPSGCDRCRFGEIYNITVDGGDQFVCELDWSLDISIYDTDKRHKDCPLIELPPHGRLIDADALVETFRERKRPTLSDGEDGSKERVRYIDFISTLQAIKDAPTILEAEVNDG